MRKITYWLTLLMIFMIPWETLVFIPGLGTLSRFIALIVGGFWVLSVISTGTVRKISLFQIFVFLFFMWSAISIFWSVDVNGTFSRVSNYIRMTGLILVIWDIFDTQTDLRTAMQAFVLGSFIPIANLLYNYMNNIQDKVDGAGRYALTDANANTTAIVIAFAIPVALYLGAFADSSKKGQLLRMVNYAYVPLALFAIILTGTRFAMIMSIPALIFGVASLTKLNRLSRLTIAILLLGGIIYVASIAPRESFQRLGTTVDEISEGNLNRRTEFWEHGIDMWIEKPILGIGSAAFPKAVESIYGIPYHMHNSFIAILVETGIVGFLLFAIILGIVLSQIIYLPKWEAGLWLTVFVVWGLGNMAMTYEYKKTTWLLLSFIITATRISHQQGDLRFHAERRNQVSTATPQMPSFVAHTPITNQARVLQAEDNLQNWNKTEKKYI